MICSECRNECEMKVEDNSFDHAFGTEICYAVVSDCCEADVLNDDGTINDELPEPPEPYYE